MRFFLGADEAEVSAADFESPLFLGEVTDSVEYVLGNPLPAGDYFWKVAPVTEGGLQSGPVFQFTVADLLVDPFELNGETVNVDAEYTFVVNLEGDGSVSWEASTGEEWISFEDDRGTTPGQLTVKVDATQLDEGESAGAVQLTTAGGVIDLPVRILVAPLNLTHLRDLPGTARILAISEDSGSAANPNAYLLEIDTESEEVTRVVPAGSSVTDFELHADDNRIYVTNWRPGDLLAFNRDTFEHERTYGFNPWGTGFGVSGNDVHQIAVGAAGRLVIEEEDQWINLRILDTESGEVLATSSGSIREGAGETSPDGRSYYHAEWSISSADLMRYDLTADQFNLSGSVLNTGGSSASRRVLVSDNGERVFWGSNVYDSSLQVEWNVGSAVNFISPDGSLAFTNQAIFDVDRRVEIFPMPVNTTVGIVDDVSEKVAPSGWRGHGLLPIGPFRRSGGTRAGGLEQANNHGDPRMECSRVGKWLHSSTPRRWSLGQMLARIWVEQSVP